MSDKFISDLSEAYKKVQINEINEINETVSALKCHFLEEGYDISEEYLTEFVKELIKQGIKQGIKSAPSLKGLKPFFGGIVKGAKARGQLKKAQKTLEDLTKNKKSPASPEQVAKYQRKVEKAEKVIKSGIPTRIGRYVASPTAAIGTAAVDIGFSKGGDNPGRSITGSIASPLVGGVGNVFDKSGDVIQKYSDNITAPKNLGTFLKKAGEEIRNLDTPKGTKKGEPYIHTDEKGKTTVRYRR